MGCKRKLAPGQWWNFCGETDMGQTLPALCTECGGSYILDGTPNHQKLVEDSEAEWLASGLNIARGA